MSSDKTSVSYQGVVQLDEVKAVLRSLLASLDEGKVVVQRGTEHVTLTPAGTVELELTGKEKKDRQSLELEISWRKQEPVQSSAGISITSIEPEPQPEALVLESAASLVGPIDGDE